MTTEKHDCSERIFSGARWDMAGHPCSRKGVVERDGKWWCRQHDPVAKKARDEERRAKNRAAAEWEAGLKQAALEVAARLGAGSPRVNPITFKYDGGITLTLEQARELAARLEAAERERDELDHRRG